MAQTSERSKTPRGMIDLASAAIGGKVLWASDDFFAEKENLIKAESPIFIHDRYTDRGKWMDGWESRRKRTEGHDALILKLGQAGFVHEVNIDTSFFLGNHPPWAEIFATNCSSDPQDSTPWFPILNRVPLMPGRHNWFKTDATHHWTHLKLNIFPDGGVARLRCYGKAFFDWLTYKEANHPNLLSLNLGPEIVALNDDFFSPGENLLRPGRGINMADGWETRRRRVPGNDWLVLKLPHRAIASEVVVDTAHFKGNYPDGFSLEVSDQGCLDWSLATVPWQQLVPRTKLEADREHHIKTLNAHTPFRYVRLSIYPDGGISRLRILGSYQVPQRLPQEFDGSLKKTFTEMLYSEIWAEALALAHGVPLVSEEQLLLDATKTWQALPQEEKRKCLALHPRIGDLEALTKRFAKAEQSQCQLADTGTIEALARYNKEYEDRFGFGFVICARGQTAKAMLASLKQRLTQGSEQEFEIACREHLKIVHLRLSLWLAQALAS